ncbi:NUDIX domain-containing protein [Bradyrhizobium septentrionale]|nr:NUDIX domain-containing protein [Bradyrhizobium septentrionale]
MCCCARACWPSLSANPWDAAGGGVREGTSALLISTDGRLLMQRRDDLPHISDPGKISLFGGRREGTETFLECVVREVHEEIGYYLPPERFELIGRYSGPDYATPDGNLRGEVFLVRDVPVDKLTVTEGRLVIVAIDELERLSGMLAAPAEYALAIFLKRKPIT